LLRRLLERCTVRAANWLKPADGRQK